MGYDRHFAVFAVEIEAESVGAGGDGEGRSESGFCFIVYCFITEATSEFPTQAIASGHNLNLSSGYTCLQSIIYALDAMLLIELTSQRIRHIIARIEPVNGETSLRILGSTMIEMVCFKVGSVE